MKNSQLIWLTKLEYWRILPGKLCRVINEFLRVSYMEDPAWMPQKMMLLLAIERMSLIKWNLCFWVILEANAWTLATDRRMIHPVYHKNWHTHQQYESIILKYPSFYSKQCYRLMHEIALTDRGVIHPVYRKNWHSPTIWVDDIEISKFPFRAILHAHAWIPAVDRVFNVI